ncbi:hypothetical protein C8R47DRAFT_569655 [Mycena vitilis]|nr:hypothetical protein C8R47DRAFT_569655 [Mycena vitilis]
MNDQLEEATCISNDRLISTLEKCFSELMQKQQDQSDKLSKALEAFKPTLSPATDTKTAFWNAYTTLADEHDKELQQRYSTDLDTSLIFAGLFSAVDSAFIIQIQPDIHPLGTPLVIVVAQNLLYLSLFSTLLAALLAVLGKQWLMCYSAAGDRGTVEARGLERQRKFDGLRKWHFEAVMQLFPLLLQIGLFLFSAALSTYLWTIHLSLAVVIISFTFLGLVSYTALLISAVAYPDSPFQTPLALFVVQLFPRTLWRKSKLFLSQATAYLCSLYQCAYIGAHTPLLFPKDTATKQLEPSLPPLMEGPFPSPSPAVPAVSWVLESSTDPRTVAVAAEMVLDLQWPGGMDVTPHLAKLRDGILSVFHLSALDSQKISLDSAREGMTMTAIQLVRAYCTLRCVLLSGDSSHQRWQDYWCFDSPRHERSEHGDQLAMQNHQIPKPPNGPSTLSHRCDTLTGS